MTNIHTTSQTAARKTLQTTLYDLIAAVSEVAGPDEDAAITATVTHLLNFHDVRCIGDFEGYRLMCETGPTSTRDDSSFSHFGSSMSHFERIADGEKGASSPARGGAKGARVG